VNALAILAIVLSAPANDFVARVDGTPITGSAFARRLVASASLGVPAQPEPVLDTMIDEALLSAEGHRLGLEHSPAAVARLETVQRQAAGALFLEKEIAGRIKIDEKTVRSIFHSIADFAAFDLLVFDTADHASAALGRIRKGASFATESAGTVSSRLVPDPKDAPLVMRGEIGPALAAALFGAAPGAVVGPVQLPDGFAVARLLKKQVGTEAELANRRASLEAHARKQQGEEMKHHVVAQLRERAHVTLDEAFVRSLPPGELTPQQLDHPLAKAGGWVLRLGDIADEVRAIRATGGHMGPLLRVQVASNEIDSRLLQDVAVERGFLKAPEIVALRPEHEKHAVGYAAMMRIMDGTPAPTEQEIAHFYERNADAFGQPFAQVLPRAAAGAAREKRQAAFVRAVAALRKKAAISIDRGALARATKPGA